MNNIKNIQEVFSRLFVLAIQNKINLSSFTYQLERSEFVKVIENGEYDDYLNTPLVNIFFDITGNHIQIDTSYGVFNDAYWCGHSYFKLFLKTGKSFSYLFLKKMIDLYQIYHEMDFSSLSEFFAEQENKATILHLLCIQKKISLRKLSSITGINLATISKYNADDMALYKASFKNIIKIAKCNAKQAAKQKKINSSSIPLISLTQSRP